MKVSEKEANFLFNEFKRQLPNVKLSEEQEAILKDAAPSLSYAGYFILLINLFYN